MFTWTPGSGKLFDIQVSTGGLFLGSQIVASADALGTTSFSVSDGVLRGSTLYYWRVRARDGVAVSRWSRAAFRTLSAPRVAPLLIPFPRGIAPSVSPQLRFRLIGNQAGSLDIQLSTSPLFGEGTIVTDRTGLTVAPLQPPTLMVAFQVPAPLQPATRYYWRARAANVFGVSAWRTGTFITP